MGSEPVASYVPKARAGTLAHLERLALSLVSEAPRTPTLAESARERAFAKVVRLRLIIAPALGSLATTFAAFEPTPWRRVVLGGAVTLLFGLSTIEWVRWRRYGLSALILPLNVILTVCGQLTLVTATGGLFSPIVAPVLMLVMLSGLLTDRATLLALLALIAPALWTLALVHHGGYPVPSLLPELFGGAQELERGPAPYVAAGLYTLFLLVIARVGAGLQSMLEELHADGLRARDRALAMNAEQSRALTTLTAEIAHELKNPLSSVKGLAALVAKDTSGRTSERVAVLRKEVDRMQAILDEFLNFSRPLVPLALEELSLSELARDVVRLHEGSALERGVRFQVEAAGDVWLRGDARKIRQVLINVLQNALDASPRAGTVAISVAEARGAARVTVRDEGSGLAPEIADRVFEAGVTNKAHGSGLGLVVARSLARQHGGELTLRNDDVRGALAELVLPNTNVSASL